MELTELKKYLLKNKSLTANFDHYVNGEIFYNFKITEVDNLPNGMFPISVIEINNDIIKLSTDLGTTTFDNEIKASLLIRWISKALESNNLIKIK